jgi:hypothetical protein
MKRITKGAIVVLCRPRSTGKTFESSGYNRHAIRQITMLSAKRRRAMSGLVPPCSHLRTCRWAAPLEQIHAACPSRQNCNAGPDGPRTELARMPSPLAARKTTRTKPEALTASPIGPDRATVLVSLAVWPRRMSRSTPAPSRPSATFTDGDGTRLASAAPNPDGGLIV